MSTAFIIIVGLCLGIAGYCVGFYEGSSTTTRKVLDIIEEYMANYSHYVKAEQELRKRASDISKTEENNE